MKQQIAEQTTLPSLRIAYKNQTIRKRKRTEEAQKTIDSATEVVPVNKEPLPLFNDYRFKARDYDPL